MARDEINVQMPKIDNTQSVGSMVATKQAVTVANGIKINNATANKNNTLFIVIENTASAASTITILKGDTYPNKVLGDMTIAVESGINLIQLQDPSRFECKDGSISIDFASGFTGNIFASAKRAGLLPVEY